MMNAREKISRLRTSSGLIKSIQLHVHLLVWSWGVQRGTFLFAQACTQFQERATTVSSEGQPTNFQSDPWRHAT